MKIERKIRDDKSYYFAYGNETITNWNTKVVSSDVPKNKIKLVSLLDDSKTVLITCIEKLSKLSEGNHGINSIDLNWEEFMFIDANVRSLNRQLNKPKPRVLIQTEGGIEWE